MKHKIVLVNILHYQNFSLKQLKPKMVIKLHDDKVFKDCKVIIELYKIRKNLDLMMISNTMYKRLF